MKELSLRDVTLIAVSSVDLDDTLLALLISSQRIDFGAVKLLSHGLPSKKAPDVEYIGIPPLTLQGYSRFVLGELHRHVETPYCLVAQADGFVLNAGSWSPEFLDYDYVGAPWAERVAVQFGNGVLELDRNRVGNGGFSLRSRKLLHATADIDFDALDFPVKSEDIVICHYLYDEMKSRGIRFAPIEVARRFSIESPSASAEYPAFGFHGKWWRDVLFRDPAFRSEVDAARAADLSAIDIRNIGRKDACPCGSGRKYKHCHGLRG